MYLPFSSKTREMKQNLKSSMGDMGEFMMMLATDGEFRGQIWEIIKTEFSEYIDSIAGFSPEHGYAQGQLIFDIVSLFIGVGEVKATLASFKNTKSVLRIKKEIKKTKVEIKKWINKKLPKTEKPKALPASADAPPTPKALPAKSYSNPNTVNQNVSTLISPTITQNIDEAKQIVESIDISINNHINTINNIKYNKKLKSKTFSGGHNLKAYNDYKKINNGDYRLEYYTKHPNGVITCKPILLDENNNKIIKLGYENIVSIFPEKWDNQRIRMEIMNVIKNGKLKKDNSHIIEGSSINGDIKIHVIIKNNKIITAYPVIE